MNLIVNRHLDQAERQLIYELTLKKRKSKKCHMSASQLLARQQLARELLPHQRIGPMDYSLDSTLNITSTTLNSSYANDQSLFDEPPSHNQHQQQHRSIGTLTGTLSTSSAGSITSSTSAISSCSSSSIANASSSATASKSRETLTRANKVIGLISGSLGSSGCSFSRSNSSYSGSSQDSCSNNQHQSTSSVNIINSATGANDDEAAALALSRRTEIELETEEEDEEEIAARRKANIKFNKSKLEHLNEELERRLYQYQYLVAQEKAILGTYNMMLFQNEGVNNFHLMRDVPLKPD